VDLEVVALAPAVAPAAAAVGAAVEAGVGAAADNHCQRATRAST